ncbi:MAG: TonB C-terminal domain-containing protein [Burkholderiaceae bacterium]
MSGIQDNSAQKKDGGWRQYAVGSIVIVIVMALLGFGLKSLLSGKSGAPKKAPKISLMPTTPPPPPPPPKEEKKPEPPKEQKEMKMEQQQVQKVEAPAPAPELKMEGAAGDGPSAFASGQVTSEDISKLGNDKGAFNPFNNYAGLLKVELQHYLRKSKDLRQRQYQIEVRVWVGGDGSLKRSELVGSTGDGDTDAAIRQALTSTPSFSESPPANMPQPIRLRIVTTGRT